MNATACYFVDAMESENARIARGLRRRDPSLLDQLIEQYQHRLLRYLVYLTGNHATAEDLFQETWVRVLERGRQYDGRHSFSSWLFTVARNLAIDHLRRKQPTSLDAPPPGSDAPAAEPPGHEPSAIEVITQSERSQAVLESLGKIPVEYRETIVLRFHEGLSLDEIAEVTGAPLGTVKSRLYRGLTCLTPLLKESLS
ncbi:MAG: RNA polymerase sigma factor [Acidobacteriales bacterium]|nr:RNA polymerase sigma factor [Terriglobales bacterium]